MHRSSRMPVLPIRNAVLQRTGTVTKIQLEVNAGGQIPLGPLDAVDERHALCQSACDCTG